MQNKYKLYNDCVYNADYTQLLSVSSNVSDIFFHPFANKIGICAFECFMGKSIRLPESITTLAEWCFFGVLNLKLLELSPNIEVLSRNTIYNLNELEELIIPEGIQSIEADSIYSLPKLKHIKLPSTAKVAQNSFKYLYRLKTAFLVDASKKSEYISSGIPLHAFMTEPTCKAESVYQYFRNDVFVMIVMIL